MEIRTIREVDRRVTPVHDNKHSKNTATIPRTARMRIKGYIHLVHRSKRYHGDDRNGQTEPSSLLLYRLYALYRLLSTPERNVQHSRSESFFEYWKDQV